MNKSEKLDKLVADGLIDETQKERFEQLHSEDLDVILSASESKIQLDKERALWADEKKELVDQLTEYQNAEFGEEEKPKEPGHEFKFRGDKYKFIDNAPKKIRFSGQVMTQKEIAKDQDILAELIGGGSSLIKKI